MFDKILIANRGEIAIRVARTARRLGIATVAVYSDADEGAPHARFCDEALRIGGPKPADSYLKIDRIIEAARRTGAEAVHPGYGFLSENADFAEALDRAGIVFIGPTAKSIRAMGSKSAAKDLMEKAGVPTTPGYQGADQSDATLTREAERIGFPVMVKAAAGGGGRGMRLVRAKQDLAAALSGARAEAENAFGSGELILEKAVVDGRHVEIQVLADTHGNVVHLGERDCSVQRRHQKVLEEAPSPAVGAELRARMGAAAVMVARAIGYVNAGTVEFLLVGGNAFYFLEMNTRLQVEHPVTEMVTGLDLVELQIRIAAGERLPIGQDDVAIDGHAIEARLYAEAPHKGFLPQPGRLAVWRPPDGANVRVDHGLNTSQQISPHYDPMLAKIIAFGSSREEARRRLVQALEDAIAFGISTNRAFLIDAVGHPEFVAGKATTQFIPKLGKIAAPGVDFAALGLGAVLWFERCARRHGHDPRRVWSSSRAITWPLELECGGKAAACAVTVLGQDRYRVEGEGNALDIDVALEGNGAVRFKVNGRARTANYAFAGDTLFLKCGAADLAIRETLYEPRVEAGNGASTQTHVRAPMNGKVVSVLVKEGDVVARGQRLVIVEAMKMQYEMTAGGSATVVCLAVKPGDQVATRQLLVELKPSG